MTQQITETASFARVGQGSSGQGHLQEVPPIPLYQNSGKKPQFRQGGKTKEGLQIKRSFLVSWN